MAGNNNPFIPGGGGADPSEAVPQGPAGASLQAPASPTSPARGNGMGVPPSKAGQPFADVHANLKYVQAQFKDGQRAQQVLDHLRIELDQLMEMGDVVRPEHVIEAAGRLVGHGIGATQLAQIMSDMPSIGGEGLASWIRMHDLTVSQAEMQLAQENAVLGHRLAVAGIKSIAASHLEQIARQGPPPPQHIDMTGQGMQNQLGPPAGNEGEA